MVDGFAVWVTRSRAQMGRDYSLPARYRDAGDAGAGE